MWRGGGEGLTGSGYGSGGSGGLSISSIPLNLTAGIPVDIPVTGTIGAIDISPITVSAIQFDLTNGNKTYPFAITGPLESFTVPGISSEIPVNLTVGSPTTEVGISVTGTFGHVNTSYAYDIPVTGTLGPSGGNAVDLAIQENLVVKYVGATLAHLDKTLNFAINAAFPEYHVNYSFAPHSS